MADSLEKVQQYKEEVCRKAEQLIEVGFPAKIASLHEMLSAPEFSIQNIHRGVEPVPIPVPRDESATTSQAPALMKSNEKIYEWHTKVKEINKEFIEETNLLKMWVCYLIPKIEDGNNFGVEIQELILSEIQAGEGAAVKFFSRCSMYARTRAELMSRITKHPGVEDFRRSVEEHDENQLLYLWLELSEIRNSYTSLHDIIMKNMEKLKTPRNRNTDMLY